MGSTAETQLRNDLAQGIRLLSHERGNPDTEAGRSLNGGNASTDASGGRQIRPKEESPTVRRESDPLIDTWRRSRRSQGEGADRNTKLAKETLSGEEGPEKQCQPHCEQ